MQERLEQWLPVVGYEGLYEVSSHGRVRSLDRITVRKNGRKLPCHGKVLLPWTKNSYALVHLQADGVSRTRTVHSLVAEAFLGPCPNGLIVRHGTGGSLDNSISNLSYGTYGENNGPDRVRDGTTNRGERHPLAKLTTKTVLYARAERSKGRSIASLARELDVGYKCLHKAVAGTGWRWLS